MLNKFPFGDSLLRDLLGLNPTKVSGCKVDILVSLAKCFPQLKLDAPSNIDTLKEEFRDFVFLPLNSRKSKCMIVRVFSGQDVALSGFHLAK